MYIHKAPAGKRIGAYIIDNLIFSAFVGLAFFLIPRLYLLPGLGSSFSLVCLFLYFGICEGSKLHGTLGKRMVGLKVVDARGNPLTYSQSFLRSLCRILSGFTLGIGFLIGLFQENGQTLHDLLAHTYVTVCSPYYAQNGTGYSVGRTPAMVCTSGALTGQRFPITGQGVNIGRDARSCAAAFPAGCSGISRRHCCVQFDARQQRFLLYDLGSTRGTFYANGRRVSPSVPVPLNNGEEFWVGGPADRFQVML